MLLKVTLVITYFILIFICSRLVDVGVSLVEVTSLTLLCKLLPKTLLFGYFCSGEEPQQQEDIAANVRPDGNEKEENCLFFSDQDSNGEKTKTKLDEKIDGLDRTSIHFTSYDHFLENVEDTKASVWVVWVRPGWNQNNKNDKSSRVRPNQCGKDESILADEDWDSLSNELLRYGIRTGTYKCSQDTKLCRKHHINSCSILLSMPAGAKPKGKVATFLFKNRSSCSMRGKELRGKLCLLEWIKSKLRSKVVVLSQSEELFSVLKSRSNGKELSSHSKVNVVFKSSSRIPPLLLSALSVRFTGRIKFVYMKTRKEKKIDSSEHHLLYAVTSSSNYSYGFRKGESFDYSNMDIFLRSLYPETNDIFLITLTLINMTCFLELFVQKGGPLKRIICFSWIVIISNSMLIFIWLPVLKLLQFPETGPIIDFFLKSLQAIMFSDVAAMIRKDFLLLSKHVGIFAAGLMAYGSAIGYIRFVISNRGLPRPTLTSMWNDDVNEIKEFFQSLLTLAAPPLFYFELEERLENLLQRLAMPDLWLHPLNSNDYVKHLVCWRFCKSTKFSCPLNYNSTKSKCQGGLKSSTKCKCLHARKKFPHFALPTFDCVVCLENYNCGDTVKLLPCGHFFHKECIDTWLLQGLELKNRTCPVCRWPANKRKKLTFEHDEDVQGQ